MLNKEKFKDEILEIACRGDRFAIKKDGRLCSCNELQCKECIFNSVYSGIVTCRKSHENWANSEYEEFVDWSKVPIDTKILVRDSEDQKWQPRHFAGVGKGIDERCVYAFDFGRTSFTNIGSIIPWRYAKLYKKD